MAHNLTSTQLHKLRLAHTQYPKAPEFNPSYGTAGFRSLAERLPSTVYRCGLLMAARSMAVGATTGLVVTASHNPAQDNGVKLVEPSGYMLQQTWEAHANRLAQCDNDASLQSCLQDLFTSEAIAAGAPSRVLLACDSRPSSPALLAAAAAGVQALGGVAVDCGLLTTPQLHWQLQRLNQGLPWALEDYFTTLAGAYQQLVTGTQPLCQSLIVDCANGIGARHLQTLSQHLQQSGFDMIAKCTGDGILNGGCGADFIQKERQMPHTFDQVPQGSRCASLDGDADRLVYFTQQDSTFQLFDGDKIAVLAALFVGIVQTAYANGASTAFMRNNLGIEVAVTPTGVKYLHEEAVKFDIGIYFEANGHGTVLFSKSLLDRLHEIESQSKAARDLIALSQLINQAVGDALSGVLMVEAALRRRQWDLQEWGHLYQDLPSRQTKVLVADRSVISTINAETQVAAPAGLQALIDKAVAGVPAGRAFVRPSGTEDVVRVYAEATTQEAADKLALDVARQVHKVAGGVGEAPSN
ncbi:MAG: phosphoacetylglucosamine mutase-like [Trebouxia sp. A1-2]|nr:MAG: phosphoacetylglucosamine mutase-like [Trebouxia sp. A1-2]